MYILILKMDKYQDSKIYKICSLKTVSIYIGSTIYPLHHRLNRHKHPSNTCKSKEIILYGDAYIELIEHYPCNSREELLIREGYHMNLHKDNVINKNIAGRTVKQYRIDNQEHKKQIDKQYRIDNKDKLIQYRIDNKDKLTQYRIDNKDKLKQYRIDNQEKYKQYQRQYRDMHKQNIVIL